MHKTVVATQAMNRLLASQTRSFLRAMIWLVALMIVSGCASRQCAYVAIAEKICLAPLPAQPLFTQRNELIVASSAQGPLTALAQTDWQAGHYSSAVTTPFGQRLYVLHYDGKKISFEQSELPVPIRPENVLLDTQLMWWPLAMLETQMPSGARVIETIENGKRVRELWWHDKKRVRITFVQEQDGMVVQYEQLGLNYQLLIKEIPDA